MGLPPRGIKSRQVGHFIPSISRQDGHEYMKIQTLVQLSIVGKEVLFGNNVGKSDMFIHFVALAYTKLVLCRTPGGTPFFNQGSFWKIEEIMWEI